MKKKIRTVSILCLSGVFACSASEQPNHESSTPPDAVPLDGSGSDRLDRPDGLPTSDSGLDSSDFDPENEPNDPEDAALTDAFLSDSAIADVLFVDSSKPDVIADSPLTDSGVNNTFVAPTSFLPGEKLLGNGATPVSLTANSEILYRVEAKPFEHIGFFLQFTPNSTPITMRVERYDGAKNVSLGVTDAGSGIRTLAVLEQRHNQTFWVRIKTTSTSVSGTLTTTRTPFVDAAQCTSDCAKLLQFPLRNDAAYDGYDHDGGTIFRYQWGRRDMLMFTRYAARMMAKAGKQPIFPYDFSQWDGETPGKDTGNLRHASHQRGKDVDISLYGTDGKGIWRSFCKVTYTSSGRECQSGTVSGFDAYTTATLIGRFYESNRVTMMFLDRELIKVVAPAAKTAAANGDIVSKWLPYFSDGSHLQHWPNHDNHVHVRVSETAYSTNQPFVFDVFEEP